MTTTIDRLRSYGDPKPGSRITPREMQVARLAQEGLGPDEIGRELFIVSNTVKTHLKNLSLKLGQGENYNRMRIIVELMRRGVLS